MTLSPEQLNLAIAIQRAQASGFTGLASALVSELRKSLAK